MMAHLVRCKGLGDETIVKRVTGSVDELGYRKVVIETDGEPALVIVQEKIAANRIHETIMENPTAYDPKRTEAPKEPLQRSSPSCAT